MFITSFTSARHLSLCWAKSTQSMPSHRASWSYILILATHLRLCLPSGIFPSGFLIKTLYKSLLTPVSATCPTHLIPLELITRKMLGEEYRSLSSLLYNYLHSLVASSPLYPNVLLSILFLNSLSLRSSLNLSDQVLHPCKTTGKILVLCILIFKFLDRKLEEKWFCTEW
jgi:hypothetical protein